VTAGRGGIHMAEMLSDGSLLEQCRQGDQDAATQLYARYATRLQRLAQCQTSAKLARCLDAEDIVQSIFRTFFRGVRQGYYDIPEGEDLWKLLLVIALNKIRAKGSFHTAAKRDVRMTQTLNGSDAAPENYARADDGNQVLMGLVIKESLERLDVRQREMVELRLQGHDINEIAEKTGRSKRTVERNLQEVRARLKDLLFKDQ
jgi:RNA polymerase sigma-70 factor, ECF subfamily